MPINCTSCKDFFTNFRYETGVKKFTSLALPNLMPAADAFSLIQLAPNQDPQKKGRSNLYQLNHHSKQNGNLIDHTYFFQVNKPLIFTNDNFYVFDAELLEHEEGKLFNPPINNYQMIS